MKFNLIPRLLILAILACFFILSITGCISEKRRAEICAACPVNTRDSIITKDSISYHDSAIYILQEGPREFIPFVIDQQPNSQQPKETVSNGVKMTIKPVKGGVVVRCDIDSLKQIIKGLNRDMVTYKQSTRELIKELVCKKDHVSGYDYFCRWAWWMLLAVCFMLTLLLRAK